METELTKETFVSGEASYFKKAEELKENLDKIETELADATGDAKAMLEEKREELLSIIKNEEQSRLN